MTEVIGVDRSNGCSRLDTRISEDSSPGINHQCVSMALTAAVMDTCLRRSQHIGCVLYGPSLQ